MARKKTALSQTRPSAPWPEFNVNFRFGDDGVTIHEAAEYLARAMDFATSGKTTRNAVLSYRLEAK